MDLSFFYVTYDFIVFYVHVVLYVTVYFLNWTYVTTFIWTRQNPYVTVAYIIDFINIYFFTKMAKPEIHVTCHSLCHSLCHSSATP